MHQMISDVEHHDSKYRRMIHLFFDEAAAFTKEAKAKVKETLAVVPSPLPSKKLSPLQHQHHH